MPSKKASTSLFQVALLIVLGAIAVGIWRQKLTRPDGAQFDAEDVLRGVPQASAPLSDPATRSAPAQDTSLPEPATLIDALKSNDVVRIRQVCQRARNQSNQQFLFQLLLLAMEHGSSQSIEAIDRVILRFDPEDSAVMLTALQKLLDHGDKDVIGAVLNAPYRFSIDGAIVQKLVLSEFSREPWDPIRFERASRCLQDNYHSVMKDLIVISTEGSVDRWRWLVEKLEDLRSRNLLYSSEVDLALNKSGLATAANIDRLLAFLPFLQTNKGEFVKENLPFFKPEHFESVCAGVKGNFPPGLVDYALRQDTAKIVEQLQRDASFYRQLQARWNEATGGIGPSVEPFDSIAGHILVLSQKDSGWKSFGDWKPEIIDKYLWLWDHGFRPNEQTAIATTLYLAIRFHDTELLRQAVQSRSTELDKCLTQGIPLKPNRLRTMHDDALFIPLLEAIRDWDLEAVRLLTPADVYDWRNWKHSNPIAVAAQQRKPQVCEYLAGIGVLLNDQAREAVAALGSGADVAVLENVAKLDTREAGQLAPNLVLQAAQTGDLSKLETVLGHVDFHGQPTRLDDQATPDLIMHTLESTRRNWTVQPGIQEAVIAAIPFPRCFARLQFEGFPIGHRVVEAIMESGQSETLEIALSDMVTRRDCEHDVLPILTKARQHPHMAELYQELGMLDHVRPALKAQVAKLYQEITGKELAAEKPNEAH